MSLILPDPRLENPGLIYPGRYPSGPMKVNWDHPYSRGLILCVLCNRNGTVDLAKERVPQFNGNISPTADGSLLFIKGDSSFLEYGQTPGLVGNQPFTLFSDFKTSWSVADSVVGVCFANTGNTLNFWHLTAYAQARSIRFGWRGHADFVDWGSGFGTNARHTMLGTRRTPGDQELWVDGVSVATNNNSVSFTGGMDSTAIQAHTDSSPSYGQGWVFCSMAWNRGMDDEEATSISRNPCQILVPA